MKEDEFSRFWVDVFVGGDRNNDGIAKAPATAGAPIAKMYDQRNKSTCFLWGPRHHDELRADFQCPLKTTLLQSLHLHWSVVAGLR